jgi:fatty acid desaturase
MSQKMCYVGQLTCLFWAVAFAALGVLSLVWHVVGWTGLVVVGSIFVAGLIVSVFRPLVTVYRLSRLALEKQAQEQDVQQQ